MTRFSIRLAALLTVGLLAGPALAEPLLKLEKGDHVSIIGNTLADRMQHHGWLETMIHALHPEHDLSFRNLGFPGDEFKTRPRSANFGSPDEWLSKTEADVVLCFFGYNEALRGDAGLASFEKDLAALIDGMRAQQYNGESSPRIVFFSPIAHERLPSLILPDGSENNKKLAIYTEAMKKVCAEKGVPFVDLFAPTTALYKKAQSVQKPLTMNGIHLLDEGNRELAKVIATALFGGTGKVVPSTPEFLRLREAVLDKNLHWFSRYRVVDGYNVYGGRSKLNWHGQSNFDVMQREMEIFDVMTANRDKRIWAVARGGDIKLDDKNAPPLLEVKTNKPGPLEGGKYPYLGGKEAIDKMQIAPGMEVNLFASEEMFPELINPVQMAVDTDSRLWASVWPSYPHWKPTEPRTDRLVILPDENGDGVADKCIVFADELNSITGFEFWGGGVLVAAPPEIWFLKDTDGDDKADFKLRMLQGVSSADTHHTANAMVIGPDGGLYWSRGVFHVTNMETPTRTFRSTKTGVYRFDPRTFEIDFHFPIGPNPHGDVFDRWGYQFANDGTGGTGSYVNIGHGIGNKQWFKKRVRPVPATGLLSSSHFPERNDGNFLICNAIGVLGVLQHEIKYNGADITAEEIDPILLSSDPNFRPTDLEVGGDGALYVSDWANALIGHMQHNIRDPNRDHAHGRIYRVTAKGRPLLTPAKMKGRPIAQVCENFFARENGTRYRARLELSGRETDQIKAQVGSWAAGLDPSKASNERDEAQALLECLWVFEEHRIPNRELLAKVLAAAEPRVRAAAIRTLGHWGPKIVDWEPILLSAARDESALVRAEAVKAAVWFEGLAAAEVIFEVAGKPTDPELDTVLKYAQGKLNIDQIIKDAVASGRGLSPAAQDFALRNASVADLLKLERTPAVYRAILRRQNVPAEYLTEAIGGLAKINKTSERDLVLDLIEEFDAKGQAGNLDSVARLLVGQPVGELRAARERIAKLAEAGSARETRQLGYAALIVADGGADAALKSATREKESLRDLLESLGQLPGNDLRGRLYDTVRGLVFDMPSGLVGDESTGTGVAEPGILVDYFHPSASNVALETLAKMKPKASGVVPRITMNVPQRKEDDKFALRFTGQLRIDRKGKYTFYTTSDDGSRLYVGGELVVNNDGLHGMAEKKGTVNLTPGTHPLVVTYFDNGGGDGLAVHWSGRGIKKQPIPTDRLSVTGSETLHDVAIRALGSLPGHEADKFRDLSRVIVEGKHRPAAIGALGKVTPTKWPAEGLAPLGDALVAHIGEIPAPYRNRPPARQAFALGESVAAKLPDAKASGLRERLGGLSVRSIPIGTVKERMIYDVELIVVRPGEPVEFAFSNTDNMPHNFAVILPGALEEVGLLAEATARDKDAPARHYIPKSDKILVASKLLQPGQKQAIFFEAPTEPGIYPYVCTYPGHWRRMHGALYVVDDMAAYTANAQAFRDKYTRDELLKYALRNTEWKVSDLEADMKMLAMHAAGHAHGDGHGHGDVGGRSFEVGRQLFKVASCVACHKLNGEGFEIGPDLTKLDPKWGPVEIIGELIEPSKRINEKYQSYQFLLDSGQSVSGLIVEETGDAIKVVNSPVPGAKPIVIKKDSIEAQKKSEVSIMPLGVLNKLTREEILDLVAYVAARGNKKHKIYAGGHKH